MATIEDAMATAMRQHWAGQLEAAERIYHQVLAVNPDHAVATHMLGVVAYQRGEISAAATLFERAIALNGSEAAFHSNLGLARYRMGRLDDAVAAYRAALTLAPNDAAAHYNLGLALKDLGRLDEAAASFRRSLELQPNFAEAHYSLGNVFYATGDADQAAACYRRALQLEPNHVGALNNMGRIIQDQRQPDAAMAFYRRALELKPDCVEVIANLGKSLQEQGSLDDALGCYSRAMQLQPQMASVHSNLVYTMLFCPQFDANALYLESRRWNQLHAQPLAGFIRAHDNDRSPERPLRIGYVSPDLRDHVVGRNLLPLLREHDRRQFEIFCYANVTHVDAITARFQSYAHGWRNIVGQSDDAVAETIRADRIDILVDLALHMAGNRLPVFARKPAPVQATFAGYPGTTGLDAIDYRLSDPHLDPAGLFDGCYSEQTIRLRDSFWCYDPIDAEPAVNELPAASAGTITFGCLNNFCKINPGVLKLWARILHAVAGSRMMILANEGAHRERTLAILLAEGIAADRVTFAAGRPRSEYLRLYHQIDIGLDTLPYNGHTTSLDSLWMGVPVITMTGRTVVGRAGLSQLTNLGLQELAAEDEQQFVKIAVELASDLPRLSELRKTLRKRVEQSVLMDATRFARNIEAAYREIWRAWIAKSPGK